MILDVETARELAYGGVGDFCEGFEIVENEMIGRSRWAIQYSLVVKDQGGKLWYVGYFDGATESQFQEPFEWDDQVEFSEVEPFEVVKTEYRRVS